jgi:hypothetical protein
MFACSERQWKLCFRLITASTFAELIHLDSSTAQCISLFCTVRYLSISMAVFLENFKLLMLVICGEICFNKPVGIPIHFVLAIQ